MRGVSLWQRRNFSSAQMMSYEQNTDFINIDVYNMLHLFFAFVIELLIEKSIFLGLTLWIYRVECGEFHCGNGVILARRK